MRIFSYFKLILLLQVTSAFDWDWEYFENEISSTENGTAQV